MFQIRIHGRGGQGVVSAAEILSVAAFLDGKHAQAFPSFGSERTGAPVMAFCRISEKPIRLREPVMNPDALIVQDMTLLHQVGLFEGLKEGGFVLLNTSKSLEDLGVGDLLTRLGPGHVVTVPASELALEHLGRPLPNAALLGGFAALTETIRFESLERAIMEKFPGKPGEGNVKAALAAFDSAHQAKEAAHARAN